MDSVNLIALSTFAGISAFTPGPNNLMLAASGANFGLRRTVPHICGVTVGFLSLVVMASLGLSSLFTLFPQIIDIARFAGILFLLYLSWKIATSAPPEEADRTATPLGFGTALMFQFINPKAVIVITSSVTVYIGKTDNLMLSTAIITFVFAVVTIMATVLWTYGGSLVGAFLQNRQALRRFNFVMAGLLLFTLMPVLLGA